MTEHRTAILSRMFIILGLLFLIPFALAFQLVRINYVEGEGLRSLWAKQAVDYQPIPAERGNIYDRNGTLLATNSVDYQIALDPRVPGRKAGTFAIDRDEIRLLSSTLDSLTGKPAGYHLAKVNNAPAKSRYIVLAKNVSSLVKQEIEFLNLRGVIIEERVRRTYTFGPLAAHALGFVNHTMEGRTGIEAFYNDQLNGQDGVQQVRKDSKGRVFEYVGAPRKQPENGYALYTTIDSYIQAILEDELKTGVEKHQANYGVGIIMDPRTGAIKALANYPTFDPNYPGSNDAENRRNYAISDMMEPGSTFKLVTAIAAVEQDVVDFNEIFETPENGEIEIHGLTLRDHDPLGNINFAEVIRQSSNVATAEIAMRLQNETFYQYARNLGFGTPTYVDISGEESGRMAKPYEWSMVSLPWMSHGYELLATPLQITQAYAAFANGGRLMRPYMVDRIEDSNGNLIETNEPTEIRKVARKSTLERLLPIFESVVSDSGTGEFAQVEGLRIAGKTGTAKKVVNGRYTNRYRGSFAGFFPVEEPKYVCYILLDEPKPVGYGGYTAGPVFRQVATRIMGLDRELLQMVSARENDNEFYAIMPNLRGLTAQQAERMAEELELDVKFKGDGSIILEQIPLSGDTLYVNREITLTLNESQEESPEQNERIALPDLRGMSIRQAIHVLHSLDLQANVIGSGTVFAQFPLVGAAMRPGREVTIRGKARSLENIGLTDTN